MYFPQEDSYFLSEILKRELKKENKKISFLDLGCGSCIQALTAKKLGIKNILCIDIDKEAIEQAKKLKFKAIKSNLFSKVKGKFNTISFNPPYLPEDKYDKNIDTSGGKKGDETIIRFLKQAKSHIKKEGKIFLLFSSHTPQSKIKNLIKEDYKIKNIFEKSLFMEKLFVYELMSSNT